ncbi:hypothetical protein GCM10007320_11200 [Pseudorhodoferax aquiterrae]|uniref:Uncharacterized protein n=2 Tax=Pseudorhodoferax aquiterrae TaxID=747304 RepID=A0ABQ3FX93_9BURK|nr:hypothetical protein GCM10007320_11200 [Pseudorhodoferax aquiterrae]
MLRGAGTSALAQMRTLAAGLLALLAAAAAPAAEPAAPDACAHGGSALPALPRGSMRVWTAQGSATLVVAPVGGSQPAHAAAATADRPQMLLQLESGAAPLRASRQPLFSSLVTPGLPGVVPHMARVGSTEMVAFVHEDGDPVLLAVLVTERDAVGGASTRLHLGLGGGDETAAPMAVAALEHLYAYVSRLPPEQAFRFATDAQALAQGDALARLAQQRQCAVRQLSARAAPAAIRPWRTVRLQPKVLDLGPDGDGHTVAVSVQDGAHAVGRSTVTFTRDPHLVCFAQVDAQGMASCRLSDAHFHAHRHDNEGEETVATFSGAVDDEATYLPTTARWANPRRAFTQPIPSGLSMQPLH